VTSGDRRSPRDQTLAEREESAARVVGQFECAGQTVLKAFIVPPKAAVWRTLKPAKAIPINIPAPTALPSRIAV